MPKCYTLAIFLFLFIFQSARGAEPPYQMSEKESVLTFREAGKLIVIEASVNGMVGNFLFDTGIEVLTLNQRFFPEEERLNKFRKVTDINGSREKLEGCLVGSFRWGGVARDSFYTPLVDLAALEKILEVELLGLLGWEVFQEVEVFINYDAQQMVLRQLDGSGEPRSASARQNPDHVMPFNMEHHLPVLNARIGEQDLRMGWDSGASINILNKKLRRNLPENARKLMNIPYGGVLSDHKAPFVAVDAIYIDDQFAVTAWRMALSKMGHFEKRDINIDGIIGADLFRLGKVAINYRKKEISVWINENIFSLRYQPIGNDRWAEK